MTLEDIKSYLSNIEESLFDEKRIVTYSWLSKTFGIHCNVSKQLLYTFFENSPKKAELSVTYLLIGLPNDEDSHQILIVKDKDLQEVEKNLKSVTSKHIYSIQKCQDLTDINVLYTPHTEESSSCISKGVSSIEFNSKERDNALIAKLRQNALPAAPAQLVAAKKVDSQPANKLKSPDKNRKNEEGNKVTTGEQEKASESSKSENKKTVVPSMFNNAAGSKKKVPQKAAVNKKKPQGISAFFTKTANKPSLSNESKKVLESKEESKIEETLEKTDPIVDRVTPLKENKATLNICTEAENKNKMEESPKKLVLKPKTAESKPKVSSKKTAINKGGKKKPVKKGDSQQKKRKRLVVLSDSESNNSSENEEEVEREPTPEPQPTFNPDEDMDDDVVYGTPEPSKKRKKRKLVSRTYKDADGFMVVGTGALRGITLLVTPPVVEKGEDVELACNYNLEGAPLYTIKFYRGVHEFYRFSPLDNPAVKLFPFPGLQIDMSQSRNNRVVLRSAGYSLAGNVSCEVSTDAPQFLTGIATQNILVVELPRSPQRIETEAAVLYEAGDRLKAKCISAPARPAPSLSWFINDEPATTNSTQWYHSDQLETREVTLDLPLLPRHVAPGRLTLRCTALVASVYKKTVKLTLNTRSGPGEPQHDRVRFSSATQHQLLPGGLVLALALQLTLR